MSKQLIDYYEVLGVDKHASLSQIKQAYRTLIKTYHPDRYLANQDKALLLNEAYETLKDPQKRQKYDCLYREQFVNQSWYAFGARAANLLKRAKREFYQHIDGGR